MISVFLRFGVILLILVCFGCGKKDEGYFVRHPEKLKTILLKCYVENDKSSKKCVEAFNVYDNLSTLTREYIRGPEDFGSSIISMQEELSKLEERIVNLNEKLDKSDELDNVADNSGNSDFVDEIESLNKKREELEEKIRIRLKLVAVAEGM